MPGGDVDLIIPTALAAEIQAAADDERRPATEIVREALEFYLESRRWRMQAEQEMASAKALGIPEDADVSLTEGYRETLRQHIAQGLESARQGRLVDGDAVFARLNAELDELERPAQT